MDARPALRPQDLARAAAPLRGAPLPLHQGSLRGPPSRPSGDGSPPHPSGGAPATGGASPAPPGRPLRVLNSADGVLGGGGGGVGASGASSPVCSLPAIMTRSNSHGSSPAGLMGAAARPSGGGAGDDERLSVHSFESGPAVPVHGPGRAGAPRGPPPNGRPGLPALANNNWVMSPSQTPPGHGGGLGGGPLQVSAVQPALGARLGRGHAPAGAPPAGLLAAQGRSAPRR